MIYNVTKNDVIMLMIINTDKNNDNESNFKFRLSDQG